MCKKNGCPYQSTSGNLCVHKGMNVGKIKKVFCPFKDLIKCKWYNEWANTRKLTREALK